MIEESFDLGQMRLQAVFRNQERRPRLGVATDLQPNRQIGSDAALRVFVTVNVLIFLQIPVWPMVPKG